MSIIYLFIYFRWGIVHTEKFWRENAKLVEHNDFELLKDLIRLLASDSTVSHSFS